MHLTLRIRVRQGMIAAAVFLLAAPPGLAAPAAAVADLPRASVAADEQIPVTDIGPAAESDPDADPDLRDEPPSTTDAAVPVAASCAPGELAGLAATGGDTWAVSKIELSSGVAAVLQTVVNPGGSYQSAAVGDAVNRMDALAVAVDGNAAYLTDSDARLTGQIPRIHKLDLATGALTTFAGTALAASTPAGQPGISAGAIDSSSGIYYYAHAVADSYNWLLYGWDTTTDTPLGVLGTVNAQGLSNGDLAFDNVGDLVLTASGFGITRFHRVAAAAVPRAESTRALPFTLVTTRAAPVISGTAWSGAVGAFTDPSIFLGAQAAGSGRLHRWLPGSGAAPTETPIVLPDGSTDLAGCDPGDVITVQNEITSRFTDTDQFAVAVTGADGTASATTTGTSLGIRPERAVLSAPPGTYTVSQSAASGLLGNYVGELVCTHRSGGWVASFDDPGSSHTLDHAGGALDCVWRNQAVATLTVTLSLSLGRSVQSDQFTVELRADSPTGTLVSAPAHATTAGTNSVVQAGTGTTGQIRTDRGTSYHVGRAGANAATLLSSYTPRITCTDPSGLQGTLPTATPFAEGFSIEVADGAQVTCVLDHARTVPSGPVPACGPGEVHAFTTALSPAGQSHPLNRRADRVLIDNPPAGTLGSTTSAAATPLPLPPTGGYDTVNAAAVSPGGRYLYYVAGQPADANSSPAVMRYDVTAPEASWTPQPFDNPSKRNITRGGLNPTNGLFYLSVTLGTDPTQHDFWAFDTLTDSMVGYIGRWSGPAGINGDLAFDQAGNMIFVAAGDLTGSLLRVENMPTTVTPYGTNITSQLTTKTLVLGAAGLGAVNGAAFDTDGYLYLSFLTITADLGTSSIRRVDPNDGTVLSTIAVSGMGAVPVGVADLADCNDPHALQLRSDLVDRVLPTDQFNLVISPPPGSIDLGNRTSTSGSATGPQPTVAGPVVGVPGRAYTLTQVTSSGSLSNYELIAACRDLNHDVEVPVSSTGTAGVYTVIYPPLAPDGVPAFLDCTITTTPTTRIGIRVELASARLAPTDQFSVHARAALPGAPDLPIIAPATNRVSSGAGTTVDSGTGRTGMMPAVAGSAYQYWLTGAGNPPADTDRYITSVTCTDTRSRQTGLPTNEVFTVPLEITPVLGAHLNCVFSNRVETSIRLTKELGRDRVDPADQFKVEIYNNQSGLPVGTGVAVTTGTGATVTPGSGSLTWNPTLGQSATLREAKQAGTTSLSGYDTTIHCTNGWTDSPTVLPSGPGQEFSVTAAVGDRIDCVLLNSASPSLHTSIGLLTLNGQPLGGGRMIKGGDVLGYRVQVSNSGKVAGSAVLVMPVPQHSTYTGDLDPWLGCEVGQAGAGTLCTREVTVAPGAPQSFDFHVTIDADLAWVPAVTASVSVSEGQCDPCSTTMATAAILSASKELTSVNGEPAAVDEVIQPEDELVYTITVTNSGGSAGSAVLTETMPMATLFNGPIGPWVGCALLPEPTGHPSTCTRSLTVPGAVAGTPGSTSTTFEIMAMATTPLGALDISNVLAATHDGADICTEGCTVRNPIRAQWQLSTVVKVVRGGETVVMEPWDVVRPGEMLDFEVWAYVTAGTVENLQIVDNLEALLDDAAMNGPATVSIDGGPPGPVGEVGTAPNLRLQASGGTLSALQGAVLSYSVTVGEQAWAATLRNDATGAGSFPPRACRGFGFGSAATCNAHLVTPALVLVHNLGAGVNGPVDLDGAAFIVLADNDGIPGDPLSEPQVVPFAAADGADEFASEAAGLLGEPVVVAPTGAPGRFLIEGIDPGYYWLRMTHTPTGHNLMATDVPILVDVQEEEPNTIVMVLDIDPKSPVTVDPTFPDTIRVVDTTPFALPYTGGPGTDWLALCGWVIVAASGVLLLRWRRRSNRTCPSPR